MGGPQSWPKGGGKEGKPRKGEVSGFQFGWLGLVKGREPSRVGTVEQGGNSAVAFS
jgi:hypothetical protein